MSVKNKIVTQTHEAQIAVRLLERWGGHPALPDGESSDGRQKFRTTTPEELARRAIDVAEAFTAECYRRGHLFDDE